MIGSVFKRPARSSRHRRQPSTSTRPRRRVRRLVEMQRWGSLMLCGGGAEATPGSSRARGYRGDDEARQRLGSRLEQAGKARDGLPTRLDRPRDRRSPAPRWPAAERRGRVREGDSGLGLAYLGQRHEEGPQPKKSPEAQVPRGILDGWQRQPALESVGASSVFGSAPASDQRREPRATARRSATAHAACSCSLPRSPGTAPAQLEGTHPIPRLGQDKRGTGGGGTPARRFRQPGSEDRDLASRYSAPGKDPGESPHELRAPAPPGRIRARPARGAGSSCRARIRRQRDGTRQHPLLRVEPRPRSRAASCGRRQDRSSSSAAGDASRLLDLPPRAAVRNQSRRRAARCQGRSRTPCRWLARAVGRTSIVHVAEVCSVYRKLVCAIYK